MITQSTAVHSSALSEVIYNVLEDKLPLLSGMIANVSRTFERSKLNLFDIKTKLYIAKDDVPLSGKFTRGHLLSHGRTYPDAF